MVRILLQDNTMLTSLDNPRSISRYCDDSDSYRELSSKLLCLMMTTLSGTLYLYQGQELGMRNAPLEWDIDEYKDCEALNYLEKVSHINVSRFRSNTSKIRSSGDPENLAFARETLQRKARDHSRTPMQWSAEANAGFCDPHTSPWMRVNDDYKEVNAQVQAEPSKSDQLSTLHFWRRGLANRKEHKRTLVYGNFELLDADHPTIFAYKRTSSEEVFVVVLNFHGKHTVWDIPDDCRVDGWVAGNYTAGKPEKSRHGKLSLRPWEGIIGKCIRSAFVMD